MTETFTEGFYVYTKINESSVLVGKNNTETCNGFASLQSLIQIDDYVTHNGVQYNILEVGVHAFYECVGVKSISISNNVEKIYKNAFDKLYCAIDIMELPERLEYLGAYSFASNKIGQFIIGKDLKCYQEGAFAFNPTSSKVQVDSRNMYLMADERGILFDKMRSILYYIPSKLADIKIPEGVVEISARSFDYNKNIYSVTFPSTVSKFGYASFHSCPNLTEVKILGNIDISVPIFAFCANFTIIYHGTVAVKANAFYSSSATIFVCKSYKYPTFGNISVIVSGLCPEQNKPVICCTRHSTQFRFNPIHLSILFALKS